jgi:putative molybdopterin biosynthesis protein
VGLDYLLDELNRRGTTSRVMSIGSLGGLAAARRGECDIAGVHLLDEATGRYNRPLLTPELELIAGYRRLQGVVFRKDDARFTGRSKDDVCEMLCTDTNCVMVNRNRGSGTRVLIDQLLDGAQPDGYANQPSSHNAVAAAVAQGRADWGVAIENVAQQYSLGFVPLQHEEYDFVVPRSRLERPAVRAFRELLAEPGIQEGLRAMGFEPS